MPSQNDSGELEMTLTLNSGKLKFSIQSSFWKYDFRVEKSICTTMNIFVFFLQKFLATHTVFHSMLTYNNCSYRMHHHLVKSYWVVSVKVFSCGIMAPKSLAVVTAASLLSLQCDRMILSPSLKLWRKNNHGCRHYKRPLKTVVNTKNFPAQMSEPLMRWTSIFNNK